MTSNGSPSEEEKPIVSAADGKTPVENVGGSVIGVEAVVPEVVILVHGIRDFALWHETVGKTLSDAGFKVEFTNYGRFDLFRFLLPLGYFRRQAIEEVLKQIRIAKETSGAERISVIAHSFGTYVVSHILQENFDLKFQKIIFCGSVVRYGFPFEQFFQRFEPPILNEVGTRDIWPATAESVTWGYGSAGTYGFRRPLVKDRWHNNAGHGFFLNADFCRKYWVPFLVDGLIVPASADPEKPRVWIQLLSIFRLKYLLLVLGVIALVAWQPAWSQRLAAWLSPGKIADSTSPVAVSTTLSLAAGESPYLARKITAPIASIAARYKDPAEYPVGYYLWPELDYDIILFTLRAGEEGNSPAYMGKADFLDETDATKRDKRVRIWSMFEALGSRIRVALKEANASGQTLRELLPVTPDDDGQLGIAFLRLVYPRAGDADVSRQKNRLEKAVRLADQLIPPGASLLPAADARLNEAVRLLATHRVQPVLNLSVVNTDRAQVVTAVRLEVLEVVGAFSVLESGPLSPVDTVQFDLGPKPETIVKILAAPIKIAPNDAVTVRLNVRSTFMFGYLCRVTLLAGERPVGQRADFLVDFGFQPAEGG